MLFRHLFSHIEQFYHFRTTKVSKRSEFSDVFSSGTRYIKNCSKEIHTNTTTFAPTINCDACVANCIFSDISSDQDGGAIGCSGTSTTGVQRIYIEETTFTTCKTTNINGGGIFFSNADNGECAIFRTCSFNCSSTRSNNDVTLGQYAYTKTKEDASSKNEVNETTITGSKKESAFSKHALNLYYSNIICSAVNITNNECCYCTALYCSPTNNAGSLTCFIMHTSIVNNNATSGYGCIDLGNKDAKCLIFASNIINNEQDKNGIITPGTIHTYAYLFINESCIIGNNKGEKVFYASRRSIKITNCTLDSDIMTNKRYAGSVTVISSKEYSFINSLSHIVVGKCESSFDSNKLPTPKRKETRKRIPAAFRKKASYVFLIICVMTNC